MQAAAIDRFGGIEELRVRTLPVPEVGPEDVLVRIEAAGVGSWDREEREGGFDGAFGMPATFPYVLGWDGAGTVAAVGSQVARVAVGDRVYVATMPLPRGGTYAEYAVVAQEGVAPIPEGLSTEQAAALPWDALTALSGLDELALRPGETLLVLGASGGIGHLALQLARRSGVRVLAVASGEDGVALATRLGAEAAVDGRREDVVAAVEAFAPGGVDAALLVVGGEPAERALTAVRDGGRAAFPHGVSPEPRGRPGVRLAAYDGVRGEAATTRLAELIGSGPFEVSVAATLPLDRVADAHRLLETHRVGKVVLRPA